MSDHAFIGRFPIFDTSRRTVGYELFVRDGVDDLLPYGDRERSARRLLSAAVHRIGLDELIARRDVWVPVAPGLLAEGHHRCLPASRTLLQITPDLRKDDDAIASLERARRAGYRIALDLGEASDAQAPFEVVDELGLRGAIHALKFRHRNYEADQLTAVTKEAKKRDVLTVAIDVHTAFDADESVARFNFLQGDFVFDPRPAVEGERVDRLAAMQLIAELERPNVSFEDVERLISRDASLVVRILTLANSSLFSRPKRIDSVRNALLMLGLRNVRHLALMLTLNSVTHVPRELTLVALLRARQCELLAESLRIRGDIGFTVGLLSLISVFAGMPTDDALAELPLADEVRVAIASHDGTLGQVLAGVIACENGAVAEFLGSGLQRRGDVVLEFEQLAASYAEALQWAEHLRSGDGSGA